MIAHTKEKVKYSYLLAWQYTFQTYDWGRVVGDVEVTMKGTRYLLTLT